MNYNAIADLHCDLLCYLAGNGNRSPYDLSVRCSVPQLKAGHVQFQAMAIFTETSSGSSKRGKLQVDAFKNLLQNHFDVFERFTLGASPKVVSNSIEKISILPAIENASSFCEEDESLEAALKRLTQWQSEIGKFMYVSLTWNMENRFGGGAHSRVGLKDDGKHLLEYLSENAIAVDFSHTSDALAFDILDYIEHKGLKLRVLASHSNARAIRDVPRNLPDDIIKEITRRGGIIGMNLIRDFVGSESIENFSAQLEHFLSLDTERHLCLGADFFHDNDLPIAHRKAPEFYFFPDFSDASAYPRLIELWRSHKVIPENLLGDICYNNVFRFLGSDLLHTRLGE